MICQVLLEHMAPPLYCGQQGLLEWAGIHLEPHVNDLCTFQLIHLPVNSLVAVNLLLEVVKGRRAFRNTLITCVCGCGRERERGRENCTYFLFVFLFVNNNNKHSKCCHSNTAIGHVPTMMGGAIFNLSCSSILFL